MLSRASLTLYASIAFAFANERTFGYWKETMTMQEEKRSTRKDALRRSLDRVTDAPSFLAFLDQLEDDWNDGVFVESEEGHRKSVDQILDRLALGMAIYCEKIEEGEASPEPEWHTFGRLLIRAISS